MAKTKPAPRLRFAGLLAGAPYYAAMIRRAEYLGPCVVQAPAAWCRVGPTWRDPVTGCWLCVGPGAAMWGTSEGLAELSTSTAPRPTWHAVGASLEPAPNICFAVLADVLAADHMTSVRELSEGAAEWIARGCP